MTSLFLQDSVLYIHFTGAGARLGNVTPGQLSVLKGDAGRFSLLKRFASSGLFPQAYLTASGLFTSLDETTTRFFSILACAQWNDYPTRFSELHFNQLERILDQDEPDYKT